MQANVNKFIAALNTFAAASNAATRALRDAAIAAGFTTAEDAKPIVLKWAGEKYGVPMVESQSNRNKGEMVLDRSHPGFETAKKAAQRALEALTGDADASTKGATSNKKDPLEVPAEIAAAAAKLAKLCAEYEDAKRLASQAVAEAFVALKAK